MVLYRSNDFTCCLKLFDVNRELRDAWCFSSLLLRRENLAIKWVWHIIYWTRLDNTELVRYSRYYTHRRFSTVVFMSWVCRCVAWAECRRIVNTKQVTVFNLNVKIPHSHWKCIWQDFFVITLVFSPVNHSCFYRYRRWLCQEYFKVTDTGMRIWTKRSLIAIMTNANLV